MYIKKLLMAETPHITEDRHSLTIGIVDYSHIPGDSCNFISCLSLKWERLCTRLNE